MSATQRHSGKVKLSEGSPLGPVHRHTSVIANMPYRFPYSAETLAMPDDSAETHHAKKLAMARERASRYRQPDYEPRRPRPATAIPEAQRNANIIANLADTANLIAIDNPLPVAPVAPAVRQFKRIPPHVRTMMLELATAKNEQWECPICRGDEIPNEEYSITHCGHHFCRPCLDTWLGQARAVDQCPTCRVRI